MPTNTFNLENRSESELSPSQVANESVAWTRKRTIAADPLSKSDLYGQLFRSSVAVIGETPTGRRALGMELPHIQSENLSTRLKVRTMAEGFYQRYLTAAVDQGLLTEEEAIFSEENYGSKVNLSKLRVPIELDTSSDREYSGRERTTNNHAPAQNTAAENESKHVGRKVLMVIGGVSLLTPTISACMNSADIATNQPRVESSEGNTTATQEVG